MDYRLVVAPMLATMMLMAGAGVVFADNDVVEPNGDQSNFESYLAEVVANVTDITSNTVDELARTDGFSQNMASIILDSTKIMDGVTGQLSDSASIASGNRDNQFGVVLGETVMNVMLITSDVTDTLDAHVAPVSEGLANIIKDITHITDEVTELLSGQGSSSIPSINY